MEVYLKSKYYDINISGNIQKNHYCYICSGVQGLFACFYCILYGLYICEIEDLKPIILLDKDNLYYDETYGVNVFKYFYKQRSIPSIDKNTHIPTITIKDPAIFLSWCRISTSEKKISNLLIEKYFKLRPELIKLLRSFSNEHFASLRILGVHYRGTDKVKETPILSFNEYEKKINKMLDNNICDKFFFCSDEFELRNYVKKKYLEKVILYGMEGTYQRNRQDEGLHFAHLSPYLSGKDAIMECYLLSHCQLLLSSHKSSMSLFATFINPEILHLVIEP